MINGNGHLLPDALPGEAIELAAAPACKLQPTGYRLPCWLHLPSARSSCSPQPAVVVAAASVCCGFYCRPLGRRSALTLCFQWSIFAINQIFIARLFKVDSFAGKRELHTHAHGRRLVSQRDTHTHTHSLLAAGLLVRQRCLDGMGWDARGRGRRLNLLCSCWRINLACRPARSRHRVSIGTNSFACFRWKRTKETRVALKSMTADC